MKTGYVILKIVHPFRGIYLIDFFVEIPPIIIFLLVKGGLISE